MFSSVQCLVGGEERWMMLCECGASDQSADRVNQEPLLHQYELFNRSPALRSRNITPADSATDAESIAIIKTSASCGQLSYPPHGEITLANTVYINDTRPEF